MIYELIKILLPIASVMYLGYLGKKQKWITDETIITIRKLVGSYMIPIVIFNSYAKATYDKKLIITIILMAVTMIIALTIAMFVRKTDINKEHQKFMPFLMTQSETGMLGFPLASMLFADGTVAFAPIEIGQAIFFFTYYLPLLSIADGKPTSFKAVIKRTIMNTWFIGLLLGLIVSQTGLGKLIGVYDENSIYNYFISFVTAPSTFLVLLMVGYSIEIRTDLLKPVMTTVVCRFVLMQCMSLLFATVLFKIIPYNPELRIIIALAFALPPTFTLQAIAEMKGEEDYYSATLSVYTLITIIYFAVLVGITAA